MSARLRIREAERVFDHFATAIRLVTDWRKLVDIVERYEADPDLTSNQRAALGALVDARDMVLRPHIQAPSVHAETRTPERGDQT